MNIAPGTLCLVIKGRNTGKTCTVLGPATAEEVLAAHVKGGVTVGRVTSGGLVKVDTLMLWGPKGYPEVVYVAIPYMATHNLLPIPPLADPTTTKQEEEKPCIA